MTEGSILEVENLRVSYGNVEVLFGVDISVRRDAVTAIIGPNGAGKTSLLWAILGMRTVRSGMIRFEGEDITRLSTHERVARGLCLVPEGRRLFPALTVKENLLVGAHRKWDGSAVSASLDSVFELFPVLKGMVSRQAGGLSGGEQQMVAVGRALMGKPKVLLLDEPSLGLAPLIVARIYETLRELRQDGLSMLLVEQETDLALDVAQYAYVLQSGEVAKEAPAEQLSRDPGLAAMYFGADLGAATS